VPSAISPGSALKDKTDVLQELIGLQQMNTLLFNFSPILGSPEDVFVITGIGIKLAAAQLRKLEGSACE
jgi:hypothetical protein